MEKKMSQPTWKLVAQLGDVHPIDYGGYFIYEDTTGVYPPEAEVLLSPDEDDSPEGWEVYRFALEPCTFINGVLSDNKFHPDKSAWFQDRMGEMCNCFGIPLATWIDMITHGNITSRAEAWRIIGEYHGWANLDSYSLTFKNREEVEKRYPESTWRISTRTFRNPHGE